MGENHSVLANTNTPSSSLMQIPIPTLSRESEKDVSMLHLYLPGDGFVQFLIALVACLVHILCFTSWAFVQLSINALARSQIDWHISCKSFHTLLFLFFQILHMSVLTTERWVESKRFRIYSKQQKCLQDWGSQQRLNSKGQSASSTVWYYYTGRSNAGYPHVRYKTGIAAEIRHPWSVNELALVGNLVRLSKENS